MQEDIESAVLVGIGLTIGLFAGHYHGRVINPAWASLLIEAGLTVLTMILILKVLMWVSKFQRRGEDDV